MTSPTATTSTEGRDLFVKRVIHAKPEKVFAAWTDPALLKQWFAPLPWTVSRAETDVRVGGCNLIVMRSPEGQEYPGHGVYLEVIKNQRLVFTNAFMKAWEPSEQKPLMVVELTFEPQGDNTNYIARVRHWTIADREAHEKMGFHQGWVTCAEQLAALVE
jgi:uncharacterized protein YndB with AHSA1/START domain